MYHGIHQKIRKRSIRHGSGIPSKEYSWSGVGDPNLPEELRIPGDKVTVLMALPKVGQIPLAKVHDIMPQVAYVVEGAPEGPYISMWSVSRTNATCLLKLARQRRATKSFVEWANDTYPGSVHLLYEGPFSGLRKEMH